MPAAMRDESRLVVASAMWASILPEWLLAEVARERAAARSDRQAGEPHEKVGDAEALAYLMTASLWVPLPQGWLEIYGHLVREVNRRRKHRLPAELADMIPVELSAAKVRELEDLKAEIWKRRRGRGDGELRGGPPQRQPIRLGRIKGKRSPDDG